MIKDYEDPIFTRDEIKQIANKWKFWQGLALGILLSVAGLAILGLLTNY
jgi:hypothetical protein